MKANERRQALLEHLCEVRQSTLENLAFHFSVSQSTIRRDVLELSLSYPVYTVCGKYDGGVYIAHDYYFGKRFLSPEQEELLASLAPTLDDDQRKIIHILKVLTSWIYNRNARIYNQYGYSVTTIDKEKGTLEGKPEKKRYYIMNKKIYARRFSTDCFSDYFNELAKKGGTGLNDYLEYATEKATVEELKMQNSYFINALYKEQ